MSKRRVILTVAIDLDGVPGTMHTEESAKETVQTVLNEMVGHYNPVVLFQETVTINSYTRENGESA